MTATVQEMAAAVADAMEDESRWCAGRYALDASGIGVATTDPSACRWCADGHAFRLFPSDEPALFAAFSERFKESLTEVNDRDGRLATIARLRQLAEEPTP
jgi:hypothetical protein